MRQQEIKNLMPLTETSFYVLISLFEPLHGYGIMQKVEQLSQGRILFGPGTLYGAIKNLQSQGLITLFSHLPEQSKKTYLITDSGKKLINLEIKRLNEMVSNAQKMILEAEKNEFNFQKEERNTKS